MAWRDDVKDVTVLLCTVPSEEVGTALAKALVQEGLVACVNVVPGVRSIYRWKGEVCEDAEHLLVMKSVRSRSGEIAERVKALHPYETPELIALPVGGGMDGYLAWVREQACVGCAHSEQRG
jgi:periplasmic divalent cation tolerance protein